MIAGLRVVFRPNPAACAVYGPEAPESGACGTVTPTDTPAGHRTFLPGPRGGVVFVRWDDGRLFGVSPRDLGLEPE